MNALCRIDHHLFGGYYKQGKNGEMYQPQVYHMPKGGVLEVWKKCSRCGEFYEKQIWSDPKK